MSSPSDQFLWIGPSGLSWTTPADWDDLTAGESPANVVPGAGSTVEIDGSGTVALAVAGPGTTSLLNITGTVDLNGDFVAQEVALIAAAAQLVISISDTLDTAGLDLSIATAGITVQGAGAVLTVTGQSTIAGTITATGSSETVLGNNVVLDGGTLDEADSGSAIIIGAPSFSSGALYVDSGATLSGSGVLNVQYSISGNLLGISSALYDNGLIRAQNILILGYLSGTGTVEVLAGGTFTETLGVLNTSALTFLVDSGATLALPSSVVDENNTIDFTGADGQVVFNNNYQNGEFIDPPNQTLDFAGLIEGFAAGDRLTGALGVEGGIVSDNYADNGDGTGVLSLYDQAGNVVASFRLMGSYTTADFLVTEGPNRFDSGSTTEDFQVDAVSTVQYGISAGEGGASLVYVGPSGGAWGDAANWADATTDAPATAAPGSADSATIVGPQGFAYTVITQTGDVGTLTVEGNVELKGNVAAQSVTATAASYLLLGAGGTLSTATLDLGTGTVLTAYGNDNDGPGGWLDVTASATLQGGDNVVAAANGGVVQLANVTLESTASLLAESHGVAYSNGTFASSANVSALTIGTLNDAPPGFVMVDAGATLDDLTPTSATRSFVGGVGVVDDGTIYATNLELGETLLGDGAIIVLPGGITTGFPGAGTALAFSAETGGILQINALALGSTNSVAFAGTDVTVGFTITGSAADQFVPAPITGFAYSDELILASFAGSVAYTATGGDTGTLTVFDTTGAAIGSLNLVGDYAGVRFVNAGDQIGIVEPGNFGISSGTQSGNDFTLVGPIGAAWGDAANWTDTTTGMAATTAPGAMDTAVFPDTLGASDAAIQFVTGEGHVGTLQANGGLVYLDGTFTADLLETTLFATPSFLAIALNIEPGASLTVGMVNLLNATPSGTGEVASLSNFFVVANGAGSDFDVTGTYEALDIPPSSPSAQFLGYRRVTVENGGSAHIGAIVGSVTLDAAGNGSLDLPTAVGVDNTLLLSGTGDLLAFDTPSAATLSVAPAIAGFADGDVVETIFSGAVASVAFVQNGTSSETATLKDGGGASLGALTFSGNFTGLGFLDQVTGQTTRIELGTACYCTGTLIRTERGEVPVEALRIGDRVVSAFGGVAPVRWLGHRSVDCRRHPRPWDVMPVRVLAGAFGAGLPRRDLRLSPDHAVFVAGALMPIRHLLNGATVVQETVEAVTYFHVELPCHDVILAEGLPAESYLDTGNRCAFANGGKATALHPDFALRVWEAEACARLVRDGAELEATRSVLLERAEAMGHAVTSDPGLFLLVKGRVVRPEIERRLHRFCLPVTTGHVRLISRSVVPAQIRVDTGDHRRLGVAVSRLLLDGRPIALTDPRLSSGWHDFENAGWRWTDGDAGMLIAGVRVLEVEVAMTERYWADDQATGEYEVVTNTLNFRNVPV